jgi:hypothetical protein
MLRLFKLYFRVCEWTLTDDLWQLYIAVGPMKPARTSRLHYLCVYKMNKFVSERVTEWEHQDIDVFTEAVDSKLLNVETENRAPLKPSGYYMYHQFNIQQFYVLTTQCIYVFCVDLRTNSDYFTVQH